jgi:dynein heavy chain
VRGLAALVALHLGVVVQMEEFTPDAVSKVSKACTSICMWVRAMYVYHNVALQVSVACSCCNQAEVQLG